MKEVEDVKDIDESFEEKQVELDPAFIREIEKLKPKKMKKKHTKHFDLTKLIGIIDSDEPITDSVKDHDLI